MNQISIIIPTFNSEDTIRACLETIHKLSLDYKIECEIIIVDAGSKDETNKIAKEIANKIIVSTGISRGKARNIGANNAKNEVLVFLDSDCVITENWMKYVNKIQNISKSVVISGPVILSDVNTIMAEIIRDLLSDPFLTLDSSTFSIRTEDHEMTDAPASNLMVSREFFEEINGFPDLNFNEDTVFSKKVRDFGGKIFYIRQFEVIHKRHFDSVEHFARYFFHYGRSYANILRTQPKFIRRYAIVAFSLSFLLFGSLLSILINRILINYLFSIAVISFMIILIYSFIKYKKLRAIFIPIFFIILVLSYVSGFYYGFIKKID